MLLLCWRMCCLAAAILVHNQRPRHAVLSCRARCVDAMLSMCIGFFAARGACTFKPVNLPSLPATPSLCLQLVEQFAEEAGVAFLPKPGRTHEGLQVLRWAVLCYAMLCYAVLCGVLQSALPKPGRTHEGLQLHCAVCYAALCCAALHLAALRCVVLPAALT